jgi:hypothetical protein
MHRTLIAHAVADNQTDQDLFRKALVLEADWGLGRNPLNMIQMTTASTSLETKRSVENCYTSGSDDGTPGMHPGHTPYLNIDDWYCGMVMGCPSWLYDNSRVFPGDFRNTWPRAEAYFNTRYVYAHSEFTPRQTMRGKMALYGYLYGIDRPATSIPINNNHPGLMPGHKRVLLTIDNHTVILPGNGAYYIRVVDLSGKAVWSATRKIQSDTHITGCIPEETGFYILNIRGNRELANYKLMRIRRDN